MRDMRSCGGMGQMCDDESEESREKRRACANIMTTSLGWNEDEQR